MKNLKRIVAMIAAAVLSFGTAFTTPVFADTYTGTNGSVTAQWDADNQKFHLVSDGKLFNDGLIVPGDSIKSTVTMKNNTDVDVQIALIRVDNTNKASRDLYKCMETTVGDNGTTYYTGKLSDEKNKPHTSYFTLKPKETKEIDITISLPKEIGNECQNASLQTDWVFEAKMDKAPTTATGVQEPKEPQVSTATVKSSANKSIQSGVDDMAHSSVTKVILAILIFIFIVIVYEYIRLSLDNDKSKSETNSNSNVIEGDFTVESSSDNNQ